MLQPKEYSTEEWDQILLDHGGIPDGMFKVHGRNILYDIFYKENGIVHFIIRKECDSSTTLLIGKRYTGNNVLINPSSPYLAGDYAANSTREEFVAKFIDKQNFCGTAKER